MDCLPGPNNSGCCRQVAVSRGLTVIHFDKQVIFLTFSEGSIAYQCMRLNDPYTDLDLGPKTRQQNNRSIGNSLQVASTKHEITRDTQMATGLRESREEGIT